MLSGFLRFFSELFNELDEARYPTDKSKPHWENRNPYRYGEEDWVWVEPEIEQEKYYVVVSDASTEDKVVVKVTKRLPKSCIDFVPCLGLSDLKITLICVYAQYSLDHKVQLVYDTKLLPNMVVKEKELCFVD